MKVDEISTRYREHVELNGNTPSTGDITCYDGVIIDAKDETEHESQSITISDCFSRVRIHRASYDTDDDWLRKVCILYDAIGRYKTHLEEKQFLAKH